MIRFELKKEIISGKIFIYLSGIISLYILYFLIYIYGKNIVFNTSIEFINNAWKHVIVYLFPMFIIFICADIFTRDYEKGHLKNILLVVKNKNEIWFGKFIAILITIILLLIGVILLGIILSLFLPNFHHFTTISEYFIFLSNTFFSILPITLVFVFISILSSKFSLTIVISIAVYLVCLLLDFTFKEKSFTPTNPLFLNLSPILSIFYIFIFIIFNIIVIHKKEIKT